MAPQFGTSGLRGLSSELTNDLCAGYAAAFASLHDNNGTMFVGQDRRDSSTRIAAAVAKGAASEGLRVIDCGVLPTPAMAGAALRAGTISIMVTGSHIPADRNGLKFYTSKGEFTKADEAPLAEAQTTVAVSDTDAEVIQSSGPAKAYVSRYVNGIAPNVLAGKKIGVWLHSSAASSVLPTILSGLGAEVVLLGASVFFVPVDTEAVGADDRAKLAGWVDEHALDAVISTDGDADRPLLMDDKGQVVPGDILGPITAHWCGAEEVVTTVSANTMVDLAGNFSQVQRTKIGSPYVIAEMENRMANGAARIAGYEPNGGFLLGWNAARDGRVIDALMTRDAVLPILAVLAASAEAGVSVSGLVDKMPARRTATDRLQDVPREASLGIVNAVLAGDMSVLPDDLGALVATDQTDGVRLSFETGKVVHIRPSGNAPELRCYVEAESAAGATEVLTTVLQRLRAAVG